MKHPILVGMGVVVAGSASSQTFRKLDNVRPFQVDLPTYSYQISDDGRWATGYGAGVVRWDLSALTLLWGTPATAEVSGKPGGISANGQVVAGTYLHDSGQGFDEISPRYWANGQLNTVPMLPDTTAQFAEDISADGTVIIGHREKWPTFGLIESSVYRFNTVTQTIEDIGYFGPPGTAAWIRADATGDVIVGSGSGLSGYWTQGTGWVDLPGLLSFGYEVSDSGQYIVGTSKFGGGGFRGMIFDRTTGQLTDLGTLGGSCDMYAMTSDARFAVGSSSDLTSGHAVWWRVGVGLRKLSDDFASIIPPGWHLGEARDITPDGRFILGTAVNDQGTYQSFVIDTVPEPANTALIATGLSGLLLRRKSRVR